MSCWRGYLSRIPCLGDIHVAFPSHTLSPENRPHVLVTVSPERQILLFYDQVGVLGQLNGVYLVRQIENGVYLVRQIENGVYLVRQINRPFPALFYRKCYMYFDQYFEPRSNYWLVYFQLCDKKQPRL